MATAPDQDLLDTRRRIADGGEPLYTRVREVNAEGGSTLKHSIPVTAVELLSLTTDDQVQIEVYENGYFVRKAGDSREC